MRSETFRVCRTNERHGTNLQILSDMFMRSLPALFLQNRSAVFRVLPGIGKRGFHIPVLKKECVDYLIATSTEDNNYKGLYVDCTVGGGGE